MNELLVCCKHCGCESRIVLDGNAILITLIICVTIITTILGLVLFYNNYKKSKKITDLEKEKKQFKERLSKKDDELKIAKEELDKVDKNKEEKKKKEFLDYCYTMAKSLEEGNKEQRNDCWEILLHIHADCIPDDLRQKYKGGKIVVENVGKKE